MIDGKSVLAVICARGGSKGLPGKNLMMLGGRPMIAWSIAAAHAATTPDRVILSSEDADIIETARAHGCEAPFVRPAALAGDDSRIEDALIHALDALAEPYDYIVLLQATSPLRIAADIDGCVARCIETGAPSCVTVSQPTKSPYWAVSLDADFRMAPLFGNGHRDRRRQDLPPAYLPNGAVYVARCDWFREHRQFYRPETVGYAMPPERSADIDSYADFLYATALLAERAGAPDHHPAGES